MRRVFCLTKEGMPFTANVFYAWEGFNLRGYDVRKFESKNELDTFNLTKDDIVCGSIGFVPQEEIKEIFAGFYETGDYWERMAGMPMFISGTPPED